MGHWARDTVCSSWACFLACKLGIEIIPISWIVVRINRGNRRVTWVRRCLAHSKCYTSVTGTITVWLVFPQDAALAVWNTCVSATGETKPFRGAEGIVAQSCEIPRCNGTSRENIFPSKPIRLTCRINKSRGSVTRSLKPSK